MFFETAGMNTRRTYGITLGERLALIPMRAVVSIARMSYGKSCMDTWETMEELAREKDWDEHKLALAGYLAWGNWEDVWYYVGCFKR
mgnify:FL=1